MEAKQKALELVHQYDLMQTYIEGFSFKDAKQYTLIAVDEILNINSVDKDYDLSDYWQQVKTEINNL